MFEFFEKKWLFIKRPKSRQAAEDAGFRRLMRCEPPLEVRLHQENLPVKSLENQLNEQAEELRLLRAIEREQADERKLFGAGGKSTTVAQLLSESGLPQPSQARLRKQIPLTEKAEVVKAAIADEKEYIRKLGHQGMQNQGADSAR